MEPTCKKQQLERDILAEFPLGKNLKCSVESGDYDGPIISVDARKNMDSILTQIMEKHHQARYRQRSCVQTI